MNHGRRSEPVFLEKQDYLLFLDLLKEIKELWNVNIAAYCLMTNHYHILIQTPDANISRAMRHLNSIYTQRFNKRHGFDGSLLNKAANFSLGTARYRQKPGGKSYS